VKNPYNPYKIIHHPAKLKAFTDGELPVPGQMQIVISDKCNHNCPFCAYRMDGYTSSELMEYDRTMPTEKVLEILTSAKEMGIKAVQFTGGGEPTIHPDADDIFQAALDMGLQCALITNGARITKRMFELLPKFAWVRFSVDAADQATYSVMHGVSYKQHKVVLDNLKRLTAAVAEQGTDCLVGMGFTVTKENVRGIVKGAYVAHDCGVSNYRISALLSSDDFEYHRPIEARANAAILLCQHDTELDGLDIINLYHGRMTDMKEGRPDYKRCYCMALAVYVGCDLNIYACCNNAYSKMGTMGSIADQTLAEFWAAPGTVEAYKAYDSRKCPRCTYNDKNRFISYAVGTTPLHIDFI